MNLFVPHSLTPFVTNVWNDFSIFYCLQLNNGASHRKYFLIFLILKFLPQISNIFKKLIFWFIVAFSIFFACSYYYLLICLSDCLFISIYIMSICTIILCLFFYLSISLFVKLLFHYFDKYCFSFGFFSLYMFTSFFV